MQSLLAIPLLILLIVLLIPLTIKNNTKNTEHYYDITPYSYHWNLFKCYDMDCVNKKGLACYKWCNKWAESGGKHNCRIKCLDFGDIQSDNLKYNNYTWNSLLPHFSKISLLSNNTSF